MIFLSSADFVQNQLFRNKKKVTNTISIKQFGFIQVWRFIGYGLGPNCLQRLSAESADDTIMGKDMKVLSTDCRLASVLKTFFLSIRVASLILMALF